ncbi:MAG: Swt1 family HEPN domain-containing protein [Planctomycetota bacterium]
MAVTNQERVGKAMDLLRQGLAPFAERELKNLHQARADAEARRYLGEDRMAAKKPLAEWDVAVLLKLIWEAWNDVFGHTLGRAERSLVQELRDWRNKWAHQEPFSSDDTDRALDSMTRLLTAVSASQADEVGRMKMELRRLVFDEQMRTERRKAGGSLIETAATGALKPWREAVTPHADVASGRYRQAEFAADLWQVQLGEGGDEYRDPGEFFRRTYLTDTLKRLLVNAVRRLTGEGGDPVVQLQTNFGGGKTHSMLALYHLFGGTQPAELAGIEGVLQEAGATSLPAVRRVVLVGTKLSPGSPRTKPDGTVVRTLWGELAWQLGGREAFERVRADDERATSPGDALRSLFNDYGPCLVLIDEWVAYARQLHDQSDLPGGTFETQFSFAQVLTESAKLARQCLLVISLPASDSGTSPHAQANDAEVGGQRGREALARLQNVIGRLESSWRPASVEEGFEIVRRRLFEPLVEKAQFVARDSAARAFHDLYRSQAPEFPADCQGADYERRLKAAYPIHPELFDRLYSDWSTLLKFQRTRGVLRLMAAVIHSLWEKGDKNPLILPASIPIDDPRVQFELTRYLSDNWVPVIEKDIDGPGALPLRIDGDVPNLGKFAACRRVARTIYLGSAPTVTAAHHGIEDRQVKLGCVMPGESAAIFGDALRRLATAARHLYQDGPRYWYSTQATVTSLAEGRAEDLRRDPDQVLEELDRRLRAAVRKAGDFSRVHPLPESAADVPEDPDARLVVLGTDHPYGKEPGSPAETRARALLESRGPSPRLFRNTLVFLAADRTRLPDLDEAVRRYLAWKSIVEEKVELNLTAHQVKQAETQRDSAEEAMAARLPEVYQWLLVPGQPRPEAPIEWRALRLTGQEGLAERASKKLRHEDSLRTVMAGTVLRHEMDRVPLWRGDHVAVSQLVEDFARYLYLPRLKDPRVLVGAVRDGLGLLSWDRESFAYADRWDETGGRYEGLRGGQDVLIPDDGSSGILVKPGVAGRQISAEVRTTTAAGGVQGERASGGEGGAPAAGGGAEDTGPTPPPPRPRRFHGSVDLDPTRVGRDAGRIADEVISHFAGMVGAKVRVTLEVEAEIPEGAPENLVRTVTENSRTLKFTAQGFEVE